jgi:tetraacyldisaccharide 4'-kinase
MRSDIHLGNHVTPVLSGRSPAWPRLMALPGFLYEGVVRGRNRLFDAGLLRCASLPNPVISIGNLTVGGTGKTPLAVHVARIVCRMRAEPALLSRGYGRAARGSLVLAPGDPCTAIVQLAGDEPALIRRQVPGIWLGISGDRHAVGLLIARRAARAVFILDDGFQHRRLRRDLDIVVIDRSQSLEHNRVLPGGTLREPLTGLRRADLVVVNGRRQDTGDDPFDAFVRRYNAKAGVFHCTQQVERLVSFDDWLEEGSACRPCSNVPPVFLVAAIGNPQRFRGDITALGITIAGARFFRDHFSPRPDDWSSCVAQARACGAGALLTTEKDAIKQPRVSGFPLLVAVPSTRLAEQAELEGIIRTLIGGRQ